MGGGGVIQSWRGTKSDLTPFWHCMTKGVVKVAEGGFHKLCWLSLLKMVV